MSQHIQHHHPQQTQYVHYHPNPHPQQVPVTYVAPKDTQHKLPEQPGQQPQQPPQVSAQAAQASGSAPTPVVAKGDWTKDLVHLAKTAELKCVSTPFVAFLALRTVPPVLDLFQKACIDTAATHCSHPVGTCLSRPERQGYPGPPRAEEQVRLPCCVVRRILIAFFFLAD